MRRIYRILVAGAMVLLSITGKAQDRALITSTSIDDYLSWKSLWLGSRNPAAAGEFRAVSDSAHLNEAVAYGEYESGSFRSPYDPESLLKGRMEARSIMNAGKAVLRGSFGYGYENGEKSRWRGLNNPSETPFMLADSIPGSISNEKYSMMAAVSVPMGGKWSFGVETGYDVSLFAKHVDLRNKNTRMDFRLAPGIRWTSGPVSLGASLDYSRYTEKIEYMQVDQSTEKYLFEFSGAWACRSIGFSSAETSRMMTGQRIGGELEAALSFGNGWSLYNEFFYGYRGNSQGETGYNGLRHGDSRSAVLNDNLYIVFGQQSRLGLHVSDSPMFGYRFIQRQELDPASGIRRYVTYGSPVPCYERKDMDLGVSYELRPVSGKWEYYTAVNVGKLEEKAYEGGYGLNENFHSYTKVALRVKRHFFFGENTISLVPKAVAKFYGPFAKPKIYCDPAEQSYYVQKTGDVYAASADAMEDIWYDTPYLNAGIGIRWTRKTMSVGADFSCMASEEGMRSHATLALGIRF